MNCELCRERDRGLLWRGARARVVRVDDADYRGFIRVVWNWHVAEMTDLNAAEREDFMRIVFAAEAILRTWFLPAKVNLASLGNQTPHLHWHVIARYRDDRHFPGSVWAAPLRERSGPQPEISDASLRDAFVAELGAHAHSMDSSNEVNRA